VTCTATVTVVIPDAPTCTLSASPSSVLFGNASTLSWTTTNATSASIDHSVGVVTPVAVGGTSVSPSSTTTYTMAATGAGGTVTCTATVTVTMNPNTPSCTLVASPTPILSGGSSTLSWTTTDATSASIDNGIGVVSPIASGSTTGSPSVTTAYLLTATGAGGTVTCTAMVVVIPPPTCALSADPGQIAPSGSSVLSWTTTNATSTSIDNGIGAVSPVAGGSVSVSPADDTTYTLTATGDGGTVLCTVPIDVTTGGGGTSPSCTMSVSPTAITSGQSATLSWSSAQTSGASIDEGIGVVTPVGSQSVSPSIGTHTYTGSFQGVNGQTIQCSATLTVTGGGGGCVGSCGGGTPPPNIFLAQLTKPTEQPLAFVYLSQIPYTGLDLGPIGTAIYWLVLLAWSGGVAYLVIFKALPTVASRIRSFAGSVDGMLNAPPTAEGAHDPYVVASKRAHEQEPVREPPVLEMHDEDQATSRYSAFEGFRSFAKDGALTIDDIVKGIAELPVGNLPSFKGPELVPAYAMANAPAHSSGGDTHGFSASSAPVPADVHSFISALLQGDRTATFGALRNTMRSGGDPERFLTSAVCALDDAYRARVDGTSCDPEVERLCSSCDTPVLERLVGALSTAVDSSYREGITGAKLALTRAFAALSR